MLTKQKLRQWLRLSDAEIGDFLVNLETMVRLLPGVVTAAGSVPADPKDDMVVAAAIEAGASHIVSQDHHLRDLKEVRGIKILSIEEFESELDRLNIARAGDGAS